MYAANPEQAVKMRGLARRMRNDARETGDSYYRRLMEIAAQDLESEADRVDRLYWRSQGRQAS